jgi:hypothetical protein
MQRHGALWGIVLLIFISGMLIVAQSVLAELSYLPDGAEINTYHASGGVDRGYTKSTTGANHYRVKAHIRAWGDSPNPLKDETFHDCYNCLTTDDRVRVANIYPLTVTQHVSRKQITAAQYQGYTSDISGYSTHSCWSNGLSC